MFIPEIAGFCVLSIIWIDRSTVVHVVTREGKLIWIISDKGESTVTNQICACNTKYFPVIYSLSLVWLDCSFEITAGTLCYSPLQHSFLLIQTCTFCISKSTKNRKLENHFVVPSKSFPWQWFPGAINVTFSDMKECCLAWYSQKRYLSSLLNFCMTRISRKKHNTKAVNQSHKNYNHLVNGNSSHTRAPSSSALRSYQKLLWCVKTS